MPRPYVSTATIMGSQIVLTIELDAFLAGKPVEISGYATQNSGGFATFYDIQSVNANPDGSVVMYVKATPGKVFQKGEDVTVSLRAAQVWISVVTEGQDGQIPSTELSEGTTAPEGTTWNLKTAGWVGSEPSFQGA